MYLRNNLIHYLTKNHTKKKSKYIIKNMKREKNIKSKISFSPINLVEILKDNKNYLSKTKILKQKLRIKRNKEDKLFYTTY